MLLNTPFKTYKENAVKSLSRWKFEALLKKSFSASLVHTFFLNF